MRKFLQLTLSLLLLFVANSANAWKFTVNSPAEGNVAELFQIVLNEPAGTMWIDEMGAMPCTLKCSDGTEYTYNMQDNFSAQVAGTPLNSAEITAPGTYTLTIPAGTFHIDGAGNEEQTFTWTIGKGGEEKSPYTLTYDKSAQLLKLVKEGCTGYESTYEGGATLEGYDGWFSFNPADPEWTLMGNTCIAAYVLLADGDYTLKVQAGTYTFDGVENEAFEIKFTVGEGGGNGGGNTGDFDGEKWQEVLFEAGVTSVTVPVTFDTEGMTLTTIGREFMGTTIDVAYNTYDEKEIDWNNGTKLVITAKDNISGIVFEGQYINFASADKGNYNNGVWSGALMKGEKLTLTANDGIHIKKITVLYNGDELKNEDDEEEEGKITVAWPAQNEVIASIAQSGLLTKFTTNKDYAMVTIALENDNKFYAPHDLQVRMFDGEVIAGGVAKDVEHVVTTAVPNEKSFQLFKGDTYTLTLKGFVNPWDVPDNYDAITEVKIIGDGIEHEPLSAVKLVSISPEGTPLEPGELPIKDGKITLTFDGAVTSVTAVNARGMEGSTTYKGTQADEEGKVWTVALGDLSSLASSETQSIIFNLNITAKAADGAVVFDETKYDYRLEAAWTLIEVLEMVTTTSLMLGEDEVAVNDHTAVSVENADGIKVQVENAPAAIGFTYAVNAMNLNEDEFGQYWTVGAELAVGEGNFNGGMGYAQFENGTINFEEGNKYQVTVTVMGGNPAEPAELESYTYEINGAYVAPMTVTTSLMLGEDEIAVNDHAAVTVENADGIKVQVENEPSVIGFSYNINIMKAVEGEESTAWVADESYDIAVGEGNFNGGMGYAQFEAGTINFEEGNKYQVKVTVYGGDPTADPAELGVYTYEINGAYVAPMTVTTSLMLGEDEIAVNDHSAVTVENADGIKVQVENEPSVIGFSYNINIMKAVEGEESTAWVADESYDIAVGEGNFNGGMGYAQFENGTISFAEGNKYQVKVTIYGGNPTDPAEVGVYTYEINGSAVIGEVVMEITDAQYGTFFAPFAVKVPEGVTAYTIPGLSEGTKLTMAKIKDGVIPANTPVVVYSETEVYKPFSGAVVDGSNVEGLLTGVLEATEAPVGSYVLQNHDGKVGFFQVDGGVEVEVAANRAYLTVADSAVKAFYLNDATAIKALESLMAGKAQIYDLNGRQQSKLQKGINIVNGVKVLVK